MLERAEDPVLSLEGVRKSYRTPFGLGRIEALRGLSLRVARGETVGFLGPNGAGKTTTLKVILGLIRADAGTVQVFGRPPSDRQARHAVGFLPEQPYFYDYLTPREILELAAALFALPRMVARQRVAELIDRLDLGSVRDTPLRKLSKGWVQRVGLAQALVGSPDLVVLDEPMSGLDPLGRREVRELITSLKGQGTAVLFSSHILTDAELLCDRVAVIAAGQIRFDGPLSRFASDTPASIDLVIEGVARDVLASSGGEPLDVRERDGKWCLRVARQEQVDRLVACTVERGGRVLAVTPNRVGIEEIFSQAVRSSETGTP
ncbi:MAG: ABC transporter ATP-binding protein [bacterium]